MTSRANAALAVGMAAPLVYFYLDFLRWVLSNRLIPETGELGYFLIATMLVRLSLVLSVKRFRTASAAAIWDIFSLEGFAFPALILVGLFFKDLSLVPLALTILAVWPGELLTVATVYVVFRLVSGMVGDHSVRPIVGVATAMFTLLAFLVSAVVSHPPPATGGLAGLPDLLFTALLQVRAVQVNEQIYIASIPLYVSLLTYSAMQGAGTSKGMDGAVFVIICGTLVAILAALLGPALSAYPSLIFAIPGLLLVTITWVVTRGR